MVDYDLAGYHLPANADIADLQVHWLDEVDPHVNVMCSKGIDSSKGIDEIGNVGTAAAAANAAWHASATYRSPRTTSSPPVTDRLGPG